MASYFTLDDFLEKKSQFQLSHLTTESVNPKTKNLSQLIQGDLSAAINLLRDMDKIVFETLWKKRQEIEKLSSDIYSIIDRGDRVFLSGCGATGRLSIGLEWMWRERTSNDQVIGFMAGGDAALIKAIESFEDHPEYAHRQMEELGFGPRDLLLAVTEGGETPFVIGSVHFSLKTSVISPWFLYCNQDSELESIHRSNEILKNDKVQKLNLCVGPMAIMGSTRMQAASVQMLALYLALFPKEWDNLKVFQNTYESLDLSLMASFVQKEKKLIENRIKIIYQTDSFGFTVLTDTTERSPTFSWPSFENFKLADNISCPWYLNILRTKNVDESWNKILGRKPRTLEWNFCHNQTSLVIMSGFDFSYQMAQKNPFGKTKVIKIENTIDGINWSDEELNWKIEFKLDLIWKNFLMKLLLNNYSTITMGLMNRIENNVMTYVKASNYKLIDRCIRFIQEILKSRNLNPTYESLAGKVFERLAKGSDGKSMVLEIVQSYK